MNIRNMILKHLSTSEIKSNNKSYILLNLIDEEENKYGLSVEYVSDSWDNFKNIMHALKSTLQVNFDSHDILVRVKINDAGEIIDVGHILYNVWLFEVIARFDNDERIIIEDHLKNINDVTVLKSYVTKLINGEEITDEELSKFNITRENKDNNEKIIEVNNVDESINNNENSDNDKMYNLFGEEIDYETLYAKNEIRVYDSYAEVLIPTRKHGTVIVRINKEAVDMASKFKWFYSLRHGDENHIYCKPYDNIFDNKFDNKFTTLKTLEDNYNRLKGKNELPDETKMSFVLYNKFIVPVVSQKEDGTSYLRLTCVE